MKKFFIILLAALCFSVAASAQPKALGVRLGYGAEISYQNYTGSYNFAEFDLGVFSSAFRFSAMYNFNFITIDTFHVYAGPGLQVGWSNNANTGLILGVAGMVGVEYNFPGFPLNLSLDWRPVFDLVGSGLGWDGFGLGVRFKF